MYTAIYFAGLAMMSIALSFATNAIPSAFILFGFGAICYAMIAGAIALASKR